MTKNLFPFESYKDPTPISAEQRVTMNSVWITKYSSVM